MSFLCAYVFTESATVSSAVTIDSISNNKAIISLSKHNSICDSLGQHNSSRNQVTNTHIRYIFIFVIENEASMFF